MAKRKTPQKRAAKKKTPARRKSPGRAKAAAGELFLEIGVEEIPAGFIAPALDFLRTEIRTRLDAERIAVPGAAEAVYVTATPRRLVLYVSGLPATQEASVEERTGPPRSAAFDADGKPTKAGAGFAQSMGVSVQDLEIQETPKGPYVVARRTLPSEKTEQVCARLLPELIAAIPFRKSMRWGNGALRFARPVHWIVAVFSGKRIPFELDGVQSGMHTFGHRFLGPKKISVKSWREYQGAMKKGKVLVERDARRETIHADLEAIAHEVQGTLAAPEGLLDEVTDLVEYPCVMRGDFDEEFLRVPEEVIIASMTEHQRYFPIRHARTKKLLPHFAVVTNTLAKNKARVVRGNERVLRARLDDAKFFFEEDCKVPMEKWCEELVGMTFHRKLGTYADKVARMKALAAAFVDRVGGADGAEAARAAELCKADLVSQMVGEFPELQGVMGGHYARHAGEPDSVAAAIAEHYLPRSAADIADKNLPATSTGTVLSLADKMDSLAGFFSVGLEPSGDKDPYGLRRNALASLALLRQGVGPTNTYGLPLSVDDLASMALDQYETAGPKFPRNEIVPRIVAFVKERAVQVYRGEGYPPDLIDAVLGAEDATPVSWDAKLAALTDVVGTPDFEPLAVAFKRIANICKSAEAETIIADEGGHPVVNREHFVEDTEKRLWQVYLDGEGKVSRALTAGDHPAALRALMALREPVDRFFDDVMVMADDPILRRNRVALMAALRSIFLRLADFSAITTAPQS